MDLDTGEDLETLAWLATCDLRERELAVRGNRIWVPRLVSLRERFPRVPGAEAGGEDATYRLSLDNPGQIGGLQMKTCEPEPLGTHDVEIEVAAAALNFRDVMVTLGVAAVELLRTLGAGPHGGDGGQRGRAPRR